MKIIHLRHMQSGEEFIAHVSDTLDPDGERTILAISDALDYRLSRLLQASRFGTADIATTLVEGTGDKRETTALYHLIQPDPHAADDLTPADIEDAKNQ